MRLFDWDLTVFSDQWMGATCAYCLYEGVVFINTPSSLKKRGKSVGSVGNVGKSKKSRENFPRKVFQNAYTDYTGYTDIGLDPHQWFNTMPLHPAGGT